METWTWIRCSSMLCALAALLASSPGRAESPDEKLIWNAAVGQSRDLPTRVFPENKTIKIGYNGCKIKDVKFSEAPRKTRFEDDLAVLLGKLKAADKLADAAGCKDETVEFVPQLPISTITVVAVDASDKAVITHKIQYGPTEHLSLSVDLPVSNRKTVKYDEASHSLVPKDDNPQLYIGINYSLGDVLREETIADRTDIKLLVLASRRPLDSYGIGIGHKLSALKVLGLELKGFSLFGGYFTTRVDKIENGIPQMGEGRTKQWRVGLSYDMTTGSSWLKF